MGLKIASLNSGSNGNCYYVGTESEGVLIDAGISCREVERRMRHLGLPMQAIRGIWITHEHIDHVRGLGQLADKYNLPVFLTSGSLSGLRQRPETRLYRIIAANSQTALGEFTIITFSKYHDAADPFSVVVEYAGIRIGVFTDLGRVCNALTSHFSVCHAVFLESNYDMDMLETGPYPFHLKRRILGGSGHLSNLEALDLVRAHKPEHMTHIILSHLSRENNHPELVQRLFEEQCPGAVVAVASRTEPALWAIQKTRDEGMLPAKINRAGKTHQLTLF